SQESSINYRVFRGYGRGLIYSTLESLSDEEKQKVRSKIGFTGKEVIFVQSIPLLSFGVASLEQILEISKQIQ
ncbi:MAG: hypothetical protein O3A66_01160, partial [Proteobacteria bacterium]|nr:hypothetical protein [Pseudomonadota bacterium]